MTRKTILENRLKMASHNLYCCSENYLMDTPKLGYEKQHKEAAVEIEILKIWLKEFHNTNIESTVEYIGHINGVSYGKTYDNRRIAESIEFEVNTGAPYLYGDRRIFNLGQEVYDWFINENGGCGRYDIEKDKRCSRLIKITVDHICYVRSMKWADEE